MAGCNEHRSTRSTTGITEVVVVTASAGITEVVCIAMASEKGIVSGSTGLFKFQEVVRTHFRTCYIG